MFGCFVRLVDRNMSLDARGAVIKPVPIESLLPCNGPLKTPACPLLPQQQAALTHPLQVLEMDLTEQRRLCEDGARGQNGVLENGDASTSGRSHTPPALAADVFLEVEVLNRAEPSVEVSLAACCARPPDPRTAASSCETEVFSM